MIANPITADKQIAIGIKYFAKSYTLVTMVSFSVILLFFPIARSASPLCDAAVRCSGA